MTIRDRETRQQYEAHDDRETIWAQATNDAFEAVCGVLKERGLDAANDDRAENLVTELFRFVWDSNHA